MHDQTGFQRERRIRPNGFCFFLIFYRSERHKWEKKQQ